MVRACAFGMAVLACGFSTVSAQAQAKRRPPAQPTPQQLQQQIAAQAAAAKNVQEQQAAAAKNAKATAKAKANSPAMMKTKSDQAETLKQVFIVLANNNYDYQGHKTRAMNEIRAAYSQLDNEIRNNGTIQQKVVGLREDVLAAEARIAAAKLPNVRDNQAASDLQMTQASETLFQLRIAIVQNNQQNVMRHLDVALQEITAALAIRNGPQKVAR